MIHQEVIHVKVMQERKRLFIYAMFIIFLRSHYDNFMEFFFKRKTSQLPKLFINSLLGSPICRKYCEVFHIITLCYSLLYFYLISLII